MPGTSTWGDRCAVPTHVPAAAEAPAPVPKPQQWQPPLWALVPVWAAWPSHEAATPTQWSRGWVGSTPTVTRQAWVSSVDSPPTSSRHNSHSRRWTDAPGCIPHMAPKHGQGQAQTRWYSLGRVAPQCGPAHMITIFL